MTPLLYSDFVKKADMLLASPAFRPRRMDARLEKLDLDADGRSPIKAPALPWTELAGDGVVSESIPAFFKWKDPFAYPYLDGVCFLEDLTKRDHRKTKYCSPYLVNALCALRSVSTWYTQGYTSY
jgi:hypothetical protein